VFNAGGNIAISQVLNLGYSCEHGFVPLDSAKKPIHDGSQKNELNGYVVSEVI
jgi:hypothetical protein